MDDSVDTIDGSTNANGSVATIADSEAAIFGPVTTTDGSVATTYGPITKTDESAATLHGSVVKADGCEATTFDPVTTTVGSVATTHGPVTTTDDSLATLHGPVTTSDVDTTDGPMPRIGLHESGATIENWENVLRTNRTAIQMLIELDNGLLGELKNRNLFTKRQLDCIWPPGKKMTIDRVETLLEMLEKKTFWTFQQFCQALDVTGQDRLVKEALSKVRETDDKLPFIASDSADGGSLSPVVCPLSALDYFLLKRHWNDIVETMITDADVFGKLTEKKVFTDFQLKSLKDYQEESTRNESLLHRLEKASKWQFDTFCDIMVATQQTVIANYLRPFNTVRTLAQCSSNLNPVTPAPETPKISSDAMMSLTPDNENRPQLRHLTPPVRLSPLKEENFPKNLTQIQFGDVTPEFLSIVSSSVLKETAYKCDGKPLGRAIIINNQFFTKLKHREGAPKDREYLECLFNKLHFETHVYEDLTSEEIRVLLDFESQADHHKHHDVFVLFMLSHGKKGQIYGIDEKVVSIECITTFFDGNNCKSLINKPKLFFFQACQGDTKTKGVVETDSPLPASRVPSALAPQRHELELNQRRVDEESVQTQKTEKITECTPNIHANSEIKDSDRGGFTGSNLAFPETQQTNPLHDVQELRRHLERSLQITSAGDSKIQIDDDTILATHEKADMAVVCSTTEGYVALRHSENGSFFVRCLFEVFAKRAHEDDLQSILTEVFKILHEQPLHLKQIGEKRDTLRRKVYLLPRN